MRITGDKEGALSLISKSVDVISRSETFSFARLFIYKEGVARARNKGLSLFVFALLFYILIECIKCDIKVWA